MSRRTSRNNSYTSGISPSGFYIADVVAVNGDYVSVKVPRLGLNNIYENVPFTGFTPAVGDRIWVSFVEGKASHLLGFVGAGDTGTDITEIVAGTNLNGGGTSGSITLNLDDDITLSTVTADSFYGSFYGDLHGAIHIPVKNVSGGTLLKGTPVYATGAVGASGAVEVEASLAATAATMPAMGLLVQDLAHNGQGDVVVSGVLQNIDTVTPGYKVGYELYVDPSGGLTATRPTGRSHLVQKIGKVIREQQMTGEILVQGAGRTNDVPNSFTTSSDVIVGGELSVINDLIVDTDTLFVDSGTNNVGIGTTSPNADLEVSDGAPLVYITDSDNLVTDNAYNASLMFRDSANSVVGTFGFLSPSNQDMDIGNFTPYGRMDFSTNGTIRMSIDSSGNVGINDQTPSYQLDVNGTGRFTGDLSVNATIITDYIRNDNGNFLALEGGDGWNLGSNASGEYVWLAAEGGIQIVSSDSNSTVWANRESVRLSATGGVDNALKVYGHIYPSSTNAKDLGSSSLRWRNIYTQDLHLSNGIGDYTVVEGEEDLYLTNNLTGKAFKFALIEVDPSEVPAKSEVE